MARRNDDSGGLSLDSLMDTLTNVVGILVIILLFTVVNAADAVKRIKGFVDEISDKQYAEAMAHAQEVRKLLEQHRQDWEKLEALIPAEQLSLKRQQELLAMLKQDMEKLASSKVNIDDVKRQVEERRAAVKKVEDDIAAKEKEIASLKARLADTPARGPDQDARVVNLPDPREPPKGAKPVVFICRKGRIVLVDTPTLQAKAMDALQGASRVVVRQNAIDSDRLADIFKKKYVGDRNCQLAIRVGGDARPYLAVEPRPDAGDKTETVAKRRSSQFQELLRRLDPNKFYLDFRVYSDSFDTYLEARNAAARQGVLAGWAPYAPTSEYWIPFGPEMKMTCLGKKPAPPAAKPTDPNRPPAPADVVD
jgi:hypothetical protein